MDGFNENSNEQQAQQPMGCLHRFSKTIKVVIIGLLILLLMIPMFMIENLISERGRTQEEAIDEVSEKWSLAQTITGPYLNLQYPVVIENNGEKKVSIKDLILFPDELMVSGQLKTEILKRSIYEVNVYQSVWFGSKGMMITSTKCSVSTTPFCFRLPGKSTSIMS